MREPPLLSDLLTLRLALGDKDGGPPPDNNINWVRVGTYSPSQPPTSEPDVGTRIVDAPSPQNKVITDDTTSFRAIDPALANPVTLLRDLGALPPSTEPSPPLRLAQRPPTSPPAAPAATANAIPPVPPSEPTPDQKARTSTFTAAALADHLDPTTVPTEATLPLVTRFYTNAGGKQYCIDRCATLALPTRDYGVSFQRCVLTCTGQTRFPEWLEHFP